MTEKEWKEQIKEFNLRDFFMQDTFEIYENAAIVVITNHQLIMCKTARNGEQPHSDAFEDLYQAIYDIDMSILQNKNAAMRAAIIKNSYGSGNITARLLNENQNRLLWFSFPSTVSQSQLELLSLWCQQNAETITSVEEKVGEQFVGFMHTGNRTAKIGNLDSVLEYATTILEDRKVPYPDDKNHIVGYTVEDFKMKKHLQCERSESNG